MSESSGGSFVDDMRQYTPASGLNSLIAMVVVLLSLITILSVMIVLLYLSASSVNRRADSYKSGNYIDRSCDKSTTEKSLEF